MNRLILSIGLLVLLLPQLCFAALHADTVWECQADATAGNLNGGGFYDRDTGTSVDYSQQSSAQLNLTDFAMTQSSTTLTSATGGFTAAMAGNIIHITAGTSFDVGWYEITAYTDTNTVTLDRTAASGGNGSSGTGYVGGAMSLASSLDDEFFEQLVAGNIVYIEAGTYTGAENLSVSNDGISTAMITVEGYNSSRGDNPTGTDRPLLAMGGYYFDLDNFWILKNLRGTGTGTRVLRLDANGIVENCYANNSSGTALREGFNISGGYSKVIKCEAISTNGEALAIYLAGFIYGCYIHDSNSGLYNGVQDFFKFIGNIIDTCAIGIDINATGCGAGIMSNNTIYNCTTGIDGADAFSIVVINNLIDNCTTGIAWDSEIKENYYDYNCYSNNGTDVSNVTKGDHAITSDISLTDPANGDFTLPDSSAAEGVGAQIGANEGVTGDYNWNIGVGQTDTQSGGGGGGGAGFMVIY